VYAESGGSAPGIAAGARADRELGGVNAKIGKRLRSASGRVMLALVPARTEVARRVPD